MTRTLVVEPRPIGHRAFYLSLISEAIGYGDVSLLAPPDDPRILDHFRSRGLDTRKYPFYKPEGTSYKDIIRQAEDLCHEHSIDKVFFAYMDEFLPELLSSDFPCPVSGIWFHPYALDRRYRWLPPIDKRLRLRRQIHHAVRRPPGRLSIEKLFFLDPKAVAAMSALNPAIPATHLPDPWEKLPTMKQGDARRHFGLPDDRVIFLHIGSSEKRKGLSDVLAAFEKLPSDVSWNDMRPMLLRVGENDRLKRSDRERLSALVTADMARVVDDFVGEADFIEYFSAADWVLLPYRSFRFSSGILSNAIAAGRPVIAADHGFIGRTVRESSTGLLFRHHSQVALSGSILEAMKLNTSAFGFEPEALAPKNFIARLRADSGDI